MSLWKRIKHAASHVTHVALAPVKAVTHVASKATGVVGSAVGHIPIVGKPFHAALNLASSPLHVAENIASGARIDRVIVSGLQDQLKNVTDLAPYAKIVVGQIPLVGNSVNAAIGAGLSLAHGKSITDSLKKAVYDAIPPDAKAVFEQGFALAQVPTDNRNKMNTAYAAITDPAKKKAFFTGMSLGHAKRLQLANKAMVKKALPVMANAAKSIIKADPVLLSGAQILTNPNIRHGYEVGVGTMNHVTPPEILVQMRNALAQPDEKKGFDLALSTHVGMQTKKAPSKLSPREAWGYYTIHGMTNAPKKQRLAMLDSMAHDNSARIGATMAINELNTHWWTKILQKLHVVKAAA